MSTVTIPPPEVRARLVQSVVNGHAPVRLVPGVWACLRCQCLATLTTDVSRFTLSPCEVRP